jgi:hypothetical protein
MRKLAVAVVAVALALSAAAPAQAAIVSEKVGGEIGKVAKATDADIRAFFSGYTFILKSRNVMPSFPFNGASFVYFAPNGTMALWRGWGGDPKVYAGKWEAGWFGSKESLLCMTFAGINEGEPCVVIVSARTLIQERAQGNVFGLKGGAAAPMVLRGNQVDFKFVAKQLGL